jgi:prepilin-type N-terminal cleavage/methylation domain-containing protein
MRRTRPSSAGFTLLELILVMVIICVALAMAAPSLRGWSHGSQLRDAGDQFLTLARWARAHAASEARVHRLNVDAAGGKYWVTEQVGTRFTSVQTTQQDQQFASIPSTFGQVYTLPEGLRIQLTDLQDKTVDAVDIYPSGRMTPARVRISGSQETGSLTIECPTPTEGFSYANGQQQQQRP